MLCPTFAAAMLLPIRAEGAAAPIGPYSPAIRAGDFLYTSGQIALLDSGELEQASISTEATRVMHNLEGLLTAAGLAFEQVVKATIFLTDMQDFAEVNTVYAGFFTGGVYPARETVQVAALPRGARVEISVVAYAG